MKNTLNVRLHPTSLFLGLAAGVLAIVAMGQKPQNIRELVRVDYGPHPRDMVQIVEGVPFVVPSNRLFVVTALGTTSQPVSGPANLIVKLTIDNVVELQSVTRDAYLHDVTSITAVPAGFAVAGGSTVAVDGGDSLPDDARAWGYLADA